MWYLLGINETKGQAKMATATNCEDRDKKTAVTPVNVSSTPSLSKEFIINEDNAICYVVRGWVPKEWAQALFEKYVKEVKFEQFNITMYGKEIPQPRLQFACGDDSITQHGYSGTSITMNKWLPEVKEIAKQAMEATGAKVNSCLLNYYRDGSDYIGYHSDRETRKEYNNIVITISLGGSRRFYFQRKSDKKVIKTVLHNGDLVIMMNETQALFKHSIPREKGAGARISLTYRYLVS